MTTLIKCFLDFETLLNLNHLSTIGIKLGKFSLLLKEKLWLSLSTFSRAEDSCKFERFTIPLLLTYVKYEKGVGVGGIKLESSFTNEMLWNSENMTERYHVVRSNTSQSDKRFRRELCK